MSRLLKATFECEVITPMFLGGADQNKPELRSASLRGQLRWWFRALYGGMNGGDSSDCHSKEVAIFGGSDGDKSYQSKVLIKIKNSFDLKNKIRIAPLPHKKNMNFIFYAIPPKTTFVIDIISQRKYINEFNLVKSLLEFVSLLGGLGRRSRRGFGAFQIKFLNFETKDHVEEFIIKKMIEVKNNIKSIAQKIKSTVPDHDIAPWPIISDKYFKLKISDFAKWDDLIEKLMENIHNGLRDKQISYKVIGSVKNGRQASSLLVSVIKVGDNLLPIFSNFVCKTKDSPNESDFDNLQRFIEQKFNAKELIYEQ